jgi:basic amino acid/polyamine antiporter, APA family
MTSQGTRPWRFLAGLLPNLAFAVVSIGVVALRVAEPNLDPIQGPRDLAGGTGRRCTSMFLMFSLPFDTWARLAVWLATGLLIYFAYGVRHSRVRSQTPPESGR